MDLDPRTYESLVVNDTDVQKVVLSYLVHNCFKGTANAFVASTGLPCTGDHLANLEKRKVICNCIVEGDALKAVDLTNEMAPDLLQNNKDVMFDILALHFVELIRAGNSAGALEFAQRVLSPFGKLDKYVERLQDHITLLAYEEPEKSPVFELLSMENRQSVADALNGAILAHTNHPSRAPLERLLQQLTVARQKLSQERNKDGFTPFSLKAYMKS